MSLRHSVQTFDPDAIDRPVLALRVDVREQESELPMHEHRKGQLVLALRGGVTCAVETGLWMVPPGCGVWIPGGTPHSNRATANASIVFLFVAAGAAELPAECCTLAITPLVAELIRHLAAQAPSYVQNRSNVLAAALVADQLAQMEKQQLHLPVSRHPQLRKIADRLTRNPSDRATVADWGRRVGMSERSLARLIVQETGMTFGRWRQQLHIIVALQALAAGASVQRVSETLGYESVTAFITMFKKALGKSPARYMADQAFVGA